MDSHKASKSLLALACGDSYGSHYEHEGLSGIRPSLLTLPNIPNFPNITDDTKMAIILCNHYNQHSAIKEEILLNEYKHWAKTEGQYDGIGIHTKGILLKNKKDKNSQGNGALMRNIPFGIKLIEEGYSFDDAVQMMNIDSALTHSNEIIFITNSLALDLAINGVTVLKKDKYKDILSKIHYGQTAWVLHSLNIVIDTLMKKRKFLTGFKYITSKGGDTDTNCAIFGAIFGYKKDINKEIDINLFIGNLLD